MGRASSRPSAKGPADRPRRRLDTVAAAAQDQGKRASGIQVEPDYRALESLAGLADEEKLRALDR